ncbi:MAG TPA: cupin domain-containing protein [Nitrososphaerales archaeon]|nr:cupin domain-containing protein [Nitrososphaerales archaeon]
MEGIEVVHVGDSKEGDLTRGIVRDKAFEKEDIVIGRSRVCGGVQSAWHHHGMRDVYGFMVSGRLRFDFGEAGKDSVEATAGDFFHIPVGLVHRDVNPDQQKEAVVVNIMFGEGPPVVNVEGP